MAVWLRGGRFPHAYVSPAARRATRDVLRRRGHLVRPRAELFAHMPPTKTQYTLPELGTRRAYRSNRDDVAGPFPDPRVRQTLEVAVSLSTHAAHLVGGVGLSITRRAKAPAGQTCSRLQSVPGSGPILWPR
jgi:hypothetical protein